MEYININNGADFILIPPLNNILHYFSFYFRILRKIYIFATGYTMCPYILVEKALCPILVCTKPEKLPNNVTRKVVMVSTHIAWGCYSHICHKRFSQGLYIKTWSIQFHASCINTLIPNRNCKEITVVPDTNQGKRNDSRRNSEKWLVPIIEPTW